MNISHLLSLFIYCIDRKKYITIVLYVVLHNQKYIS